MNGGKYMFKVNREELMALFNQIEDKDEASQLKHILADLICDQFNNQEPQRVLMCGIDFQTVWNFLWQTCKIEGLSPSHWCTKHVEDAKMVDALLHNTVCANDDLRNDHKGHIIVFIPDADLMSGEVQLTLAYAMRGKIYTTYMTETPVNMNDVCFLMTTRLSVEEMKQKMCWGLREQITNLWGAI